MTPERWQSLREAVQAYDAAGDSGDTGAVSAALAEEAEALAAKDDRVDRALRSLLGSATEAMRGSVPISPGDQLGDYRIVRKLGHGGMGSVYLAERQERDFRMPVALKLLDGAHLAEDGRSYFKSEVDALARLAHPNIARLIDGAQDPYHGAYLVLEYVDGSQILEHCRRHHLTDNERIDLFLIACRAVQHAHGRLVIHCDLKPDNLMVDREGHVKLLDFGVAAIVQAEEGAARQSVRALSLGYASPEQLLGDGITVASDVYALGAILYELLTDRRLFDAPQRPTDAAGPLTEAERFQLAVEQRGQLRLSEPSLNYEIAAILKRALSFDPEERYPCVADLIADLERFRRSEPVSPLRTHHTYRLRKFLGRHGWGVSMAALLLSVLSIALLVSVAQERRLEEQKRVQRDTAEYLLETLKDLDPFASDANTPALEPEFLERLLTRVTRLPDATPELRANIVYRVADLNHSYGQFESAARLARQALDMYAAQSDPDRREVARAYLVLGNALGAIGRNDEARRNYEDAMALVKGQRSADAETQALVIMRQGELDRDDGSLDRAGARFEHAIELLRALPAESRYLGEALQNLAIVRNFQGHSSDAVDLLERARAVTGRTLGTDHASFGRQTADLATAMRDHGDLVAAGRLFEQAVPTMSRTLGSDHQFVIHARAEYGRLLMMRNEPAKAESLYLQAERSAERTFSPDPFQPAIMRVNRAHAAFQLGKLTDAERYYRDAVAVFENERPRSDPYLGTAYVGLAMIEVELDRWSSALTYSGDARQVLVDSLGADHWWTWVAEGVVRVASDVDHQAPAAAHTDYLQSLLAKRDASDYRVRWLRQRLQPAPRSPE